MQDILVALVMGNYLFTAAAFVYSWRVERRLTVHVTNELTHELAALREEVRVLRER